MRSGLAAFILIIAMTFSSGSVLAEGAACNGMATGKLASLNGFVPFPADNLWNTDISGAAVDPDSDNIIDYIGASVTLHPDFGSGTYAGHSIGIPYQVVTGSQPKVKIELGAYGDESDPGPMPVPPKALIEGYPQPGDGDRHVLVLDKGSCWLFELYHGYPLTGGQWSADSTAIWDMTIDEQRPYTWTSADAAGLPIFVGLARYDEVAAGTIKHALRFTLPVTRQAFTPPASHWASSVTDTYAPPMGMRMRLKADFDISGFSPQNQVILTALKTYGMILADNGSAIYISGAPDPRWNNDDLGNLKTITASSFEVVLMDPVYTDADVPTGPSPSINSFTARPHSVSAGQSVKLSWSTSDQIYNLISPAVGPVRGNSVIVRPSATRTYTLYSTNQYGRTTASVTVKVY
ncbi:MAG TPA: hypothetical protein VMD75_06335 [Candidatus Binataceae bacterium]|nr:hypothetical protein [Candidatus Binataceae bacterium]